MSEDADNQTPGDGEEEVQKKKTPQKPANNGGLGLA